MKNKLYFIAISAACLLPFVAPGEGAHQLPDGMATNGTLIPSAASENVAIFMPVLAWDMADLDVRDAQNQAVRDASALQDLTALFTNNLFNMTVVQNLHSIDQIWNELILYSRLFNNLILKAADAVSGAVQRAWLQSSKRFVHNVHNLWIVRTVGIFHAYAMSLNQISKPTSQPLILRC